MDFHDFMDRMRNPAAADLVRSIKSFIMDLSNKAPNPDNDSKSVQEFLTSMETTFKDHPLWAGATSEELESAGEGLEKYLMSKLYPRTFGSVPEEVEHDQRVYEKVQLLQQFIRPEHLDILPKFQNEASWLLAQKEIQNINLYKYPREKLETILNCSKIIMNICMASTENPTGADEFLPVLIYVLIKANPPQLYSNIMFIQRYRHQSRLVSEAAYYFTNLVSAESFIENLNAASVSMDEKEFEKKMLAARETLGMSTSLPKLLIQNSLPSAEDSDGRSTPSKVSHASVSTSSNNAFVQQLQAKGSSALVDADRAGQLAREFPFLYASFGDLRIEDVESLLNDYKELVLKYYSLCKAVEKSNSGDASKVVSQVRDHGHTASVEMVSDDGSSKVDRHKVPEMDEFKQPIENATNKTETALPIDDSSPEMADKNVILVNETSNTEFNLDVFQEQIPGADRDSAEIPQDHATAEQRTPAE